MHQFQLSGHEPYTPTKFLEDIEGSFGILELGPIEGLMVKQEFAQRDDIPDGRANLTILPVDVTEWEFIGMVVHNAFRWDTWGLVIDAFWVPNDSPLLEEWTNINSTMGLPPENQKYLGAMGMTNLILDYPDKYPHLHIYVGEY